MAYPMCSPSRAVRLTVARPSPAEELPQVVLDEPSFEQALAEARRLLAKATARMARGGTPAARRGGVRIPTPVSLPDSAKQAELVASSSTRRLNNVHNRSGQLARSRAEGVR